MALTTTGGYAITEIDYGVALMQNGRTITSYRITKCNNGKWRVRLSGASFGLEIGYFVSESKTFGEVFNQCVTDLNWIIDQLLSKKAGN
jgi:aminopeptidase C